MTTTLASNNLGLSYSAWKGLAEHNFCQSLSLVRLGVDFVLPLSQEKQQQQQQQEPLTKIYQWGVY